MRQAIIIGAIAAPLLVGFGILLGVLIGRQSAEKSTKPDISIPDVPKKRTGLSQDAQVQGAPVPMGTRPNIILFLSDDTGYADFWRFGNPEQEYNEIDKMATDGMTFMHWTAGDRICSPSRAAFLTGQYPVRNGIYGPETVFPYDSTGGLPRSAVTIAEALKDQGYATGMVGKWHLGCNKNNNTDGYYLPSHQGFDYVGTILPFSQVIECNMDRSVADQWRDCYLFDRETIVEQPINLTTLSQRLLNDAKTFLTNNRDGPFFLYYSFPQTHEAMFCDPRFCGQSRMGSYGDDVNEMAWALGETIQVLQDLGIDENTLQIYVSDNGPADFNCYGEGNSGIFRGGKMTTWEGGLRVPAIVRWPGTIPANTFSHNLVNTLDLWPTFMYLAGNPNYAQDNGILLDGQLIPDILQNYSIPVRDVYYYYCSDRLTAVRYQNYKIHYATVGLEDTYISNPETSPICQGEGVQEPDCHSSEDMYNWDPPLVFDLLNDPGETMIIDTSTPEMQNLLNTVNALVNAQIQSVAYEDPELSKRGGDAIVPCCQAIGDVCQCNYTST